MARLSRRFVYIVTSRSPLGRMIRKVPQPRACNACRLSHTPGLASSAFARHYSRNHCCFLFLWVLRCFTSPRSLYPPYIFRRESPGRTNAWRGFPIRTPSDQNSLISSPRLIADCYVLLRLQMPRHPPFALKDLKSHEMNQILRKDPVRFSLRCSRPLCSSQSTGGPPPPLPYGNRSKGHKETERPTPRKKRPARSLRTQQRAGTPPSDQAFPQQAAY